MGRKRALFDQKEEEPPLNKHHEGSGKTYLKNKNRKIQLDYKEKSKASSKTSMFGGMTFHLDGYSEAVNVEQMKVLIGQHGGEFSPDMTPSVTHLLAEQLPYRKVEQYHTTKRRIPLKILTGQWLIDSCKENRIMKYSSYLPTCMELPNQHKMDKFITQRIKLSVSEEEHKQESLHINKKRISTEHEYNVAVLELENVYILASFYNQLKNHSTVRADFLDFLDINNIVITQDDCVVAVNENSSKLGIAVGDTLATVKKCGSHTKVSVLSFDEEQVGTICKTFQKLCPADSQVLHSHRVCIRLHPTEALEALVRRIEAQVHRQIGCGVMSRFEYVAAAPIKPPARQENTLFLSSESYFDLQPGIDSAEALLARTDSLFQQLVKQLENRLFQQNSLIHRSKFILVLFLKLVNYDIDHLFAESPEIMLNRVGSINVGSNLNPHYKKLTSKIRDDITVDSIKLEYIGGVGLYLSSYGNPLRQKQLQQVAAAVGGGDKQSTESYIPSSRDGISADVWQSLPQCIRDELTGHFSNSVPETSTSSAAKRDYVICSTQAADQISLKNYDELYRPSRAELTSVLRQLNYEGDSLTEALKGDPDTLRNLFLAHRHTSKTTSFARKAKPGAQESKKKSKLTLALDEYNRQHRVGEQLEFAPSSEGAMKQGLSRLMNDKHPNDVNLVNSLVDFAKHLACTKQFSFLQSFLKLLRFKTADTDWENVFFHVLVMAQQEMHQQHRSYLNLSGLYPAFDYRSYYS